MTRLAYFCKGYLAAYTKASCYSIIDNRYHRFGFWLGRMAAMRKHDE